MNRTGVVLAALACLGGYLLFFRSSSAEGLAYVDDWQHAREAARDEEKPILLIFGGPW